MFWLCTYEAIIVVSIPGSDKFLSHTAIGVEDCAVGARDHAYGNGIRALSIGRLVHLKAFISPSRFRELRESGKGEARVLVMGDGSDRRAL